jgi:energy-coupling factor transporter transmembrane protein EcfT
MKTLSSIFSLFVILAVLALLPAFFMKGFVGGEFLTAWFTFVVWILILCVLTNMLHRNGQREIGELKDVLTKGKYYKLLQALETPKGQLVIVMDHPGNILVCRHQNNLWEFIPGKWYKLTTESISTATGTTLSACLYPVRDELAVATLEKGYEPQWAA